MFIWYYHDHSDKAFAFEIDGLDLPAMQFMHCNESYWLVPGTGD